MNSCGIVLLAPGEIPRRLHKKGLKPMAKQDIRKPMRVAVYSRYATPEELIEMNRHNPELVESLRQLAGQQQE